jgi:branched-chain amino acid transport system permease protein
VLIAIVLLAVPGFLNRGLVFILGTTCLHVVFGLSWNLMFRFTGLASFGHAAFFAIGGYGYGVISRTWPELHLLVAFALAAMIAAAVAALLGYIALRRSHGIYFAILTLAVSEILFLIISHSETLGREDGLAGVVRPVLNLGIVSVDLGRGQNYYYFILVCCALLSGVLWWIVNGRLGRAFRAIQQDPDRAAFVGIDPFRYRIASLTISSVVAALLGALYGPWLQLLSPDIAHWSLSARPVLYALLGGAQYFWGPAVGAITFAALEFATRTMLGLSEIIIAVILLIVILGAPGGMVGFATTFAAAMGRRRQDRKP